MHKEAKAFVRKELLRPREELENQSLMTLGWKLAPDFEDEKTIGLCSFEDKTISFSVYWMQNPSEAFFKEVILHEIAHAIADTIYNLDGAPPHNNTWRYIAKKLGCKYGARVPAKKTFLGKTIICENN